MPKHQRKQLNPMPIASPELPWQHSQPLSIKQEPADDSRNDSGVTSGSECPSASPESDRCDNNPFNSPSQNNPSEKVDKSINQENRYTPYIDSNTYSTPSTSRGTERASTSPSTDLSLSTSKDFDYIDDISVPKVNSHGKIKAHRCKQCKFIGYTKLEFWKHSSVHIKGDKALKCPRCPFVTEFKHHLEYHIMNHEGSKPYKCKLCSYTCVNNSMLRSHMKSHSKIYQYRCNDCMYETKYVHSLKLHLRKYEHIPAVVLNPDGTPNPEPVIDIYGSRRGPKTKKVSNYSNQSAERPASPKQQPNQQQYSHTFDPRVLSQNVLPLPLPVIPGLTNVFPNQTMLQHFQILKEKLEQISVPIIQQPPIEVTAKDNLNDGVLDLSKSPSRSSDIENDNEERMTTAFPNVEVVQNNESPIPFNRNTNQSKPSTSKANVVQQKGNTEYVFHCHYCGIGFTEEVMYRIHMGYHGYSTPYTCNRCGLECCNNVNFFLHTSKCSQ